MTSIFSDDKLDQIIDEIVDTMVGKFVDDQLDPKDLFALTGELMTQAQKHVLTGMQKKDVVLRAFNRLTDNNPDTISFLDNILPSLIDLVKLAARGGLDLALQTRCCGLIN